MACPSLEGIQFMCPLQQGSDFFNTPPSSMETVWGFRLQKTNVQKNKLPVALELFLGLTKDYK